MHQDDDDDDDMAAGRAGGVRTEPGVDARDVEAVAEADLLLPPEPRQADGALRQSLVLIHG